MSFGEQMRLRREALALSRAQLAARLGVSPSAISNYENGLSSPKEEVLLRLGLRTVSGTTVEYAYDALGRLAAETEFSIGTQVRRDVYTYTAAGDRRTKTTTTGEDGTQRLLTIGSSSGSEMLLGITIAAKLIHGRGRL